MAPTRAAPRPLANTHNQGFNNYECSDSGAAPERPSPGAERASLQTEERRRPGAERALAAAAALDHGDDTNYELWYASAVRRHDNPKPLKQAAEAPRKAHLLELPAELQRDITAYYCGLECPLPEALDRMAAYQAWLAELDDIRHNVKIGDQEVIVRTLRQWAESGVVSIHPRPPVRRSPHPELWHRSAEEIAMYRRQAFGLFRWRLHYYRTWEKVARVFRAVGERLRGLSPFRTEESDPEPEPEPEPQPEPEAEPAEEPAAEPTEEPTAEPAAESAEESTAEPAAEPAEEPRVLGQPRLLGRREFVPYTGPRYAPYDPELE